MNKVFKNVATIHAPRNKFTPNQRVLTTASCGRLYPCMVQEIYPGDSFNVDTTFVARLTSSYLRPVMDNLFVDFYYFFVPSRTVYDHWEEIFGENKQSAWVQSREYSAPVTGDNYTVASKTVCDYMGIPVGKAPKGINILPMRAFAKIWNEWFRDENLQDPMFINTGDWSLDEMPNSDPWSPSNYMGQLPYVNKMHDVFTSALPSTQKSLNPVTVSLSGNAPIVAGSVQHLLGGTIKLGGSSLSSTNAGTLGYAAGTVASNREVKMHESAPSGTARTITSTNLEADLTNAGILSVPEMRYAFQLQRILERAARSGSRYSEYIFSTFNIQSPDARLQRAEYLGGKRIPLSTQQVAQTTRGDDDVTALGSLGAFSLTNGKCGYSKGFTEHGFVIGVFCIRQKHLYQQGIEKFWQRSDRFSYYDPSLAFLSEQPVYRSEIYSLSEDELKGNIFGYQEAWYDLRFRNDLCTGECRSDATNSLDIWHFGDDYENAPTLNEYFIREIPDYVDRTIAVPSTSLDQFIFDIYHKQDAIRRLPLYSTPGLIDHY